MGYGENGGAGAGHCGRGAGREREENGRGCKLNEMIDSGGKRE